MDQYLSLLRFFHALVAYKVTDFRIKWICFSMENWQHLPREVGNVHTMIGWNGHPFGNIRFHQSIFIQRWNDGKSEEKHNDQNRVIPGLFRTHLELHERGSSTSESSAKLAFLHAILWQKFRVYHSKTHQKNHRFTRWFYAKESKFFIQFREPKKTARNEPNCDLHSKVFGWSWRYKSKYTANWISMMFSGVELQWFSL